MGTVFTEDASFDVLVVGAGLIGASVALGLARRGYKVALFEHSAPQITRGESGHDPRTVAISPNSQQVLSELGIWQTLEVQPYSRMHVWEDQGTARLKFLASEVGRENLGWIIEVSKAAVQLWEALVAETNVKLVAGKIVSNVDADVQGVRLELGNDEKRYRAKFLLAADGAQSSVARFLNVGSVEEDTGHSAIVTIVKTERPHSETAFQRFLHDGPVALLPVAGDGHHLALIWSQSPHIADGRMQLSDAVFCKELEQAVERVLGKIVGVDKRYSFQLQQSLRTSFQPQPRVLFLGDAAHVVHPLAGQGVNLGFEDVAELLEIAGSKRDDLGQSGLWTGYARRRRRRARSVQLAMSGFQGVYGSDVPLFQWLRNVGVRALNNSPVVKKQMMKEALGLGAFTWI